MYGANDNRGSLQWSFTLAAPLTKMNSTIVSLIALQQSIVQNNSGMLLTFQVQGAYVSPEAFQAQSCAAKDLVADAQAQAQKVAAVAGVYAGPIIAISDGTSSAPTSTGYAVPASRLGSFLFGSWYSPSPPNCFMEVKFKLLRYQ
jgi:hypothetical protein